MKVTKVQMWNAGKNPGRRLPDFPFSWQPVVSALPDIWESLILAVFFFS
jgi:hypothetical protein